MDYAEEFTYKRLNVKIAYDQDPESPRSWDNLGKIFYKHSRYTLGDEELSTENYFEEIASYFGFSSDLCFEVDETEDRTEAREKEELTNWIKQNLLILPVFAYEHGSITISTGSFSCPWDSGQVGFIVAKKGSEDLTDEKILEILKNEIKTYDQYLQGDVYGMIIEDQNGEEISSCWGFYGEKTAIDAAKEEIDALTNNGSTDHNGQLLFNFALV